MPLLTDVKVLDLSRVLAGPYCTSLLRGLGADVVKVEGLHGDDARHLGPFRDGESVYFAQLNHGKRSIALNLKDADDHATLLDLARAADVVVENFRPGVATRLGIDHAALSAINPRLVYASISGFGQDGPLAHAPAYDLVVQAMSGLMEGTGTAEGGPTRVGESVGDVIAGLHAAWGVTAALFERERTGVGRHVDVAMFDSLVSLQVTAMSILTATGALPGRVGNRHPVSAPFDTYPSKDGLVAIAVANDSVFARFCTLVGHPEAANDPRFADDGSRTAHRVDIEELATSWSTRLTTDEAVARAEEAGVPAAPIWDLAQALASEQATHRGLVDHFEHPVLGRTPFLTQPLRFPGSGEGRATVTASSPDLGADRDTVLADWLDVVRVEA
ncbi:CaiB/BaiF CoA transferase family protein [Nocardioides kongjuensis]|uniref:Formyl-CoA transferase/CoA:oxalate CoA-transferase n=1 Tax=Nocardioides kongjuensis TaxID=349522 RepID=A0A852RLY5_9ACTN|nr:CoA transferase [Nocardioides kongjuensis]NYD31628.1 formyl-CoA transferase/CoA:oxalate CoA-transferase [Nocardioides kongjuensis]